ncbi:hypothetical protein, partial [Marinobacterium stanieri]|uniref:hypothetical protein n=1 Tax=Marinobacterium stanieri TaxID=49186 RepID=UPI0002557CE4
MADQKKVVFEYLEALLQDPELEAPEAEPKIESEPVEQAPEGPVEADPAEEAFPVDNAEPIITV